MALVLESDKIAYYEYYDRALNEDSKKVYSQITEARRFGPSVIKGGPELVLDQLQKLVDQRRSFFDGNYIAQNSLYASKKFIEMLPRDMKMPELAVEEDGMISLDWRLGKGNQISISPTGNRIIFAARVNGLTSVHGEEPFFDEIPQGILDVFGRPEIETKLVA